MRTRFYPLLALLLVACNADPGVPTSGDVDAGNEDLGALGDTQLPGEDAADVAPEQDGLDTDGGADADLPDLPDEGDGQGDPPALDVDTSPDEDVVAEVSGDVAAVEDTADDTDPVEDVAVDPTTDAADDVDDVGDDTAADVLFDADVSPDVAADVADDTAADAADAVDPDTGDPPGPLAAVQRFWSTSGAVQASTLRHRAVLSFGTPASAPVSTTARHRIVWGAGGLLR